MGAACAFGRPNGRGAYDWRDLRGAFNLYPRVPRAQSRSGTETGGRTGDGRRGEGTSPRAVKVALVAQLMMPHAMRLPALPVLFVKVVAAAEFGVYWFAAVPTGMLP
jgi:hypothetical protein